MKRIGVWPTSFPNLLRLTKMEKTLNNEAMITYKRLTTVGQLLANYRSLAHSEASNQQQRGYSGPCGHCALSGKFGKHDANMVLKVTALHSKGKLFPLRQVLTCANYGIYVATCKLCGKQYDGQTQINFRNVGIPTALRGTLSICLMTKSRCLYYTVWCTNIRFKKSLKSVNVL